MGFQPWLVSSQVANSPNNLYKAIRDAYMLHERQKLNILINSDRFEVTGQ